MKSMKWMLVGSVAVAMVAVGCNKETTSGGSVPTPQNPLRQTFNDNVENAQQEFTVNATAGGYIYGQDGVAAVFAPNAFRYQNGSLVTGNVQIELVEALGVSDMVWLNKQTLGDDNGQMKPLISGGQFFMNATQGGQQLKLTPGATTMMVPASSPDPNMELFSGTVEADGDITWDPFADITGNGIDSANYTFPNDSLGWVNCDYFMNGGNQTSVQITCPTGHTEDNTIVWLVFPDVNSVTGIYNSTANVFSTGMYYTLPVGMNVIIVAVSEINGAVSSSFTSTTVTANMNQTIAFTPTTLGQFQSALEGL